MEEKTFTIKEISDLWDEFTCPKFKINKGSEIKIKDLKPSSIIKTTSIKDIKQIEIDYSRWIPFLKSKI